MKLHTYTSKPKNRNIGKNIIDNTGIITNSNIRRNTKINHTLYKDYTIKNSPSQLAESPIIQQNNSPSPKKNPVVENSIKYNKTLFIACSTQKEVINNEIIPSDDPT